MRDLGNALYDRNADVSRNTVNFFIAAMAEGMSFALDSKIILQYLQGAFGIGYLTRRPSPHLNGQYFTTDPRSQAAQLRFSLLP